MLELTLPHLLQPFKICSSSPDAINLQEVGTAASVCKAVSRVLKEDVNWELGECRCHLLQYKALTDSDCLFFAAQEASQLLDKVANEGS